MKKILFLLLLPILMLVTSCEDDPANYLIGTEWKCDYRGAYYNRVYTIKFDRTTFEVYDYDLYDGVESSKFTGSGTYTCDESSVVLMVDGEMYSEGEIEYDRITFDGGVSDFDFSRQITD